MGDQASAQITNTLFPPPPEYYKQFTQENIDRYELLKAGPSRPRPRSQSPRLTTNAEEYGGHARAELSPEETAELERLDGALGKPRADWIHEEGRWVTFGELSTVCSTPLSAPGFQSDWTIPLPLVTMC